MFRCMKVAVVAGFVVAIVAGSSAREAFAIKQFADEFKAMYVKEGSPLAKEVEAAKCNVCHMGKSKKDRNPYGQVLAERLKKDDKENVEKIRAALTEVEKLPSPDGPTFGELIAEGKLPGGAAQ